MKILLVSSYLPYPLDSGGHVRLYNLLKQLSKNHQVTLVCEKRAYQKESDIAEVKKICKEVFTVKRKKQWTIGNVFKAGISTYPFLLIGHTNLEMKQIIVKLLNSQHFDLIHVETFYVFQNLPKTYLPIVLVEHNIEYMVYEKFAKTSPGFIKPLLYADIAKIKHWEKYYWRMAKKVVAVSNADKEIIGREDTQIVPNGVDINKFKIQNTKTERKQKTILFIGNFKWIQNTKALEFILKEIWPKIRTEEKIKLWIVGKNIPSYLRMLNSDTRVVFDENAPEETEKIYQKSDILLAPITVGGGTSYKILEAMASGVAVVTTKLGVEGLQGKDRKHALVGHSAQELSDCVMELLEKPDLRKKIADNARQFVEEKYSWEKIGKQLETVYKSV